MIPGEFISIVYGHVLVLSRTGNNRPAGEKLLRKYLYDVIFGH